PPMPFSTWLFQPLFVPSILPDAYRCGRAGPAIGSLSENTFWKRRAMDPTNSIWEGRTPLHGITHAEAAVSECGTCVAYFKRRWTNVTNVKKLNSRPAQKCSGPPGTLPILPITHPGPARE